MNLRTRTASLLGATALVTAGLVASAGAPAANAADLSCSTLVGAVTAENRILYRYVENDAVVKDKTSKVISTPIQNLHPAYSEEIDGGARTVVAAYQYGVRPRLLQITNLDSSSTLGVKALKTGFSGNFNVPLLADSGSFYVYGVSLKTGSLTRWTRFQDSSGSLYYGSPKVIAKNMTGLKTLTYTWTFKVDGGYRDFLVATTKSGKLKQFQVPLAHPGNEKQVTLAASGFDSYTGFSPSFCNDNPRLLSLVAIDGTQARWYTLYSQTAPSPTIVDRGLISGAADWDLHAVS